MTNNQPSKTQAGVLFVCFGNICRSPSAEGLLRSKLEAENLAQEVLIDSCGTAAINKGKAPDPRAQKAALARGIDLSGLRARQIEDEDYEQFDVIVVMDNVNLKTVQTWAPKNFSGEIKLALDFTGVGHHQQIPDPYKEGEAAFEVVLDQLQLAIDGIVEHLKKNYLTSVA